MKVHIVIPEPETTWILGVIRDKLIEHASAEDIEITTSGEMSREADVNHYIPWWAAHGCHHKPSVLMATHITPNEKWESLAKELLPDATHLTTMSEQTKIRLEGWGIPSDNISVAHVGIEEYWQPRPIVVGLAFRIYRDGRKREKILVELADKMDLSAFQFVFIGAGWETITAQLQERGVMVTHHSTVDAVDDYRIHRDIVPYFDYWLYTTAWDEGPMGMLDALACGIQCILPPVGYCLDAAPYAYWYDDLDQLAAIFAKIQHERWKHREAVKDWTWENYGWLHQELYRRIANG